MSDEQKQFQFQPGEIVQAASGGPMMTVTGVYDSFVTCIWFDTTWHKQEADFHTACLVAHPEVATFQQRPASIWGGKVAARA